MAQKVFVYTLGCPKNEVDSDNMIYCLKRGGFEICSSADEADIILINTCCFIHDAKQQSVEAVFEAVRLKNERNELKLAVTGCMAQRYSKELREEIPEIDIIAGVTAQHDIAYLLRKEKAVDVRDKNAVIPECGRYCEEGKASAYIKISEGCDKCCTYCAIPSIRGKQRSRKMEDILSEARSLADKGVKELVVVAQDVGDYGLDLYERRMLPKLLKELETISGIYWIRLMYVYPETITDELIGVIAESKKILKYLDVPLQHINNDILKRMNRRITSEGIYSLIQKLNDRLPGIALRSAFIVGFPGETEGQFDQLCDFLKDACMLRVGAFAYSEEEGTPAALMDAQIDEATKLERLNTLMDIQSRISENILQRFVGQTLDVLIEEKHNEGIYTARSYLDAPEVDGVVYVESEKHLRCGDIVKVLIEQSGEYDLKGRVII